MGEGKQVIRNVSNIIFFSGSEGGRNVLCTLMEEIDKFIVYNLYNKTRYS